MSADNGYILRRNKDYKFVLQMYFASSESYPSVEKAREYEKFDSLQDAIERFEELDDDHTSEYGLRIQLKE